MTDTIIVTGAAGGIGAILTARLLERGYRVTAFDDLSSGSWQNIPAHENLETVTGSIDNPADLERLPWQSTSFVIHLAAISSLPQCQLEPERAFSTNVLGTLRVAALASKSDRLKLFINASTSAIYEGISGRVLTEDLAVDPHLVYSQTKLVAERYLHAMRKDRGFPVISFRFFNAFGPMQDYRRKSPPLLNYLVREAVSGSAAVLHSNGEQRRDYISVEDICAAIELALTHEFEADDVFNLCSGEQFSVRDMVTLVGEALGGIPEPRYRDGALLWDAYPGLAEGPFPLDPEVVDAETNKSSTGSPALYARETGWSASEDIPGQIRTVAAAAAAHIRHG